MAAYGTDKQPLTITAVHMLRRRTPESRRRTLISWYGEDALPAVMIDYLNISENIDAAFARTSRQRRANR